MTDSLEIRESTSDDVIALETLYPDAFPDENLLPLVRNLLQDSSITFSLVGITGSSLVGHVIFTRCEVDETKDKVVLLGPLAVAPTNQRQGIGSALVRVGLEKQKSAGAVQVYVLGDPTYYGRFGFLPELGVEPPYPLPIEWRGAWQSMSLVIAEPPRQGRLSVPRPWLQPALWAP